MRRYLSKNSYVGYQIKCRKVLNIWREIVDDYCRLHTGAVKMKDGILHVFTDSTTLANELALREREFLNLLNHKIEGSIVKRIVFRPGFLKREKTEKPVDADNENEIKIKTLKKIEKIADSINEEELKSIVKKLLISSAKRSQKGD